MDGGEGLVISRMGLVALDAVPMDRSLGCGVQCWSTDWLLFFRIPLHGDSDPRERSASCAAALPVNATTYDRGENDGWGDEILAQAMSAYLTLTLLLLKFATTTMHNMLRKKRRHRATILQLKLEMDEVDDVEDATAAFDRLTHGQKHLARQR